MIVSSQSNKIYMVCILSVGSSDNLEYSLDQEKMPATPEKQIQHRANTTMHVCWHRNTSVSMRDHNNAVKVGILYIGQIANTQCQSFHFLLHTHILKDQILTSNIVFFQ